MKKNEISGKVLKSLITQIVKRLHGLERARSSLQSSQNNFCLSIPRLFMLYKVLNQLEERAKALEVRGACLFGALEGQEKLGFASNEVLLKP